MAETEAPHRIAPFAVALSGSIPASHGDLAAGSFILFHDPKPPHVWGGDLRIVTLARAEVEVAGYGEDPALPEVIWTTLAGTLDAIGPLPHELAGSVTRTLTESFGSLRPRGHRVGLEVRASWTPPTTDVGAHLGAWLRFLRILGGSELADPPG